MASPIVSRKGARVFIPGRGQLELDKAIAAIGGDAATIQGDSSSLADLDPIYATAREQAGRIGEITEDHFDRAFNTNVRGLSFAVQKVLPLLSKGSSVIRTDSMVSIKGSASCSVYNATKAAIHSSARTRIVDLERRDIPINVLSPGYAATPRGRDRFVALRYKSHKNIPSRLC